MARAGIAGPDPCGDQRLALGRVVPIGGPISKSAASASPRSALRATAATRLGSPEGRMTLRSTLIGLTSLRCSWTPPKSDAASSDMKDQVTASTIPREASVRRIELARRSNAVSAYGGSADSRGSETTGMFS